MTKCVCFGEILLRLCPTDGTRIGQTGQLAMTYAGAEANVAVSLVTLGQRASFVTKLPEDNALTDAFLYQMRGFGVETDDICFGGERMGVFFLEQAISPRPARVLYDRKHSAISAVAPGDIDWNKAFSDADWFHCSGITPALSESAARETLLACRAARERGLRVSCDLNYRKALWTPAQARKAMTPLMEYVDVIISNESEPADLFGLRAPDDLYLPDGQLSREGYVFLAQQMTHEFGSEKCAFAIREHSESRDYIWSGLLYDAATGSAHVSRRYPLQIVDRVGGGDAFSAGLIFALREGMPDERAVRFAAASSALKHTFAGDFNRAARADVEALL